MAQNKISSFADANPAKASKRVVLNDESSLDSNFLETIKNKSLATNATKPAVTKIRNSTQQQAYDNLNTAKTTSQNVYDTFGNLITSTDSSNKSWQSALDNIANGSKSKVYYNKKTGEFTNDLPTASVSLNKETGDIDVFASNIALQNETFRSALDDTLKTLSANYKTNPDYKYTITDSDGNNTSKSIEDIINDLNQPAKNSDGTYNQSSIQYLALAAESIEAEKAYHKQKNNVDLTDKNIQTIHAIALGDEVSDNTLQAVSDLKEAEFLRNISSYDSSTGTVKYSDLMENAWNRRVASDDDIRNLQYALEQYFKKGDFSDSDAYAKNLATYKFIMSEDPKVSWWRGAGEVIMGFVNGVLGLSTDLGAKGLYLSEKLNVANLMFGIPSIRYDLANKLFKMSDFNQDDFTIDSHVDGIIEKLDGYYGTVQIDENGIPTYTTEKISGTPDKIETLSEYLLMTFKENQQMWRNDLKLLNDNAYIADIAAYEITKLAAMISAGNVLSEAAAGLVTGAATSYAKSAVSAAKSLETVNASLFAGGTGLNYAGTAAEISSISKGIGVMLDVANATGKYTNTLNSIISVAKAVSVPTLGILGESLAEAVVGDSDRFIEMIDSEAITAEDKTYLIETYIGNAIGWGIGATVSKGLINFGNTTTGRALSVKMSKPIMKVQNSVGDAFDNVLLKLRRIEGDDLAEQIESLYNKGTEGATKQANSLARSAILRAAREAYLESDALAKFGEGAEDLEEAITKAEKELNKLRAIEVATDSLSKQGQDLVQLWLKDSGADLGETVKSFYKSASNLADAEKAFGKFGKVSGALTDMTSGKTLRMFSQEVSNYIGATEKLDIINTYIAKFDDAAGASSEVLENLRLAKIEKADLENMIQNFVSKASPELKAAADEFIASDRKFWSAFEDLRASQGLTNGRKLGELRASGIWGENGELYAKTTRKEDLREYVIKHSNGESNSRTFSDFEKYSFGATGDFADPMAEMQIALYQAGSEKAYKNYVSTYGNVTGAVNVKVTGEQTDIVDRLSKKLRNSYKSSADVKMSSMVDRLGDSDAYNNIINKLSDKVEIKKSINKAKKSSSTAVEQLSKIYSKPVDSTNAGRFIGYMDKASTNDMYDEFFVDSVEDVLSTNTKSARKAGDSLVDSKTEAFIKKKAADLNIEADAATEVEKVRKVNYTGKQRTFDKQLALYQTELGRLEVKDPRVVKDMTQRQIDTRMEELTKRIADLKAKGAPKSFVAPEIAIKEESETLNLYKKVNAMLTNTDDKVDEVFEMQVKQSLLANNDIVKNDENVLEFLTSQRQARAESFWDGVMVKNRDDVEFLTRELGIAEDDLKIIGMDTVDDYLAGMLEENSGSKAVIDELCDFYGLTGNENAIRYFALSEFMDSEKAYKKKLFDKIYADIRNTNGKLTGNKQKKIASILTNNITEKIEDEFSDAYLIVKDLNSAATHADDVKIFDEIEKITEEIEGAKANMYTGAKNIVAIRNDMGQVEYMQVDPLLAHLVNFNPPAKQTNALMSGIYNANYLWSKLFRLGTTAINIKSIINQTFKDPINMWVGTGAYKTSQQCAANLTDVFGEDIVKYLQEFEPKEYAKLASVADETGESIQKLAVQRELEIGKALSPSSTETSMYKSLKNARTARKTGDLSDFYKETTTDKLVSAIDKVEDKAGVLNEIRETSLRNVSYANGLETALKRGYSLDEARTFATFQMNNGTTNFARSMNHLTSLQGTVPYLGAAVNGVKSFYRLLSFDPVGVIGRLTGGIIIPAVALTAYSLNDAENREAYRNIPEYTKEGNIIFMVGGKAFSIPLPEEIGAFISPFRQFTEKLYGVSTNSFYELAWNDILAFSPIDLSGFADLDYSKVEMDSPGVFDRVSSGIRKMWAQLAPAPLKSGLTVVTGVDPYTGKKIDTSYTTLDENGNEVVVDYKSGTTAKSFAKALQAVGLEVSAPVMENVLTNIFGAGSVDITDFVTSLAGLITGGVEWSWDTDKLSSNTAYNPLYTLKERVTAPVTVDIYDEAQTNWKRAVSQLYTMKEELLSSKEWQNYLTAKSKATSTEQLKKLEATKKNLVADYYNKIKDVVSNLQENYGKQFTATKYATTLSLMTMEQQTLDAGSYGELLNKETYKTARAQAIQTMMEYGFPSSSDSDILGKYVVSSTGDITVKTYHPLAILQLDDKSGAALSTRSNKNNYAAIKGIIDDGGAYDLKSAYYTARSKAYAEKDYDKVEQLTNEYNAKIINMVAPYISTYGAEAVLQGDTMDLLEDYIIPPSSYTAIKNKKGYYVSTPENLNKTKGFVTNYIKQIFNYGGNKINGQ